MLSVEYCVARPGRLAPVKRRIRGPNTRANSLLDGDSHPSDPLPPRMPDGLLIHFDVPEVVSYHLKLERRKCMRDVIEIPTSHALPIDQFGATCSASTDLIELDHFSSLAKAMQAVTATRTRAFDLEWLQSPERARIWSH